MKDDGSPLITVDAARCRRDGVCVTTCPIGLITMTDAGPAVAPADAAFCAECGHCVAICPTGALAHRSAAAGTPLPPDWRSRPESVAALLQGRRSIRVYRQKPVDRDTLARVIDLTRFAPSGVNRQPVRWLILYEREQVRRVAAAAIDWMRSPAGARSPLAERFGLGRLVAGWDAGRDPVCRGAPHLVVAYAAQQEPTAPGACLIALSHLEIAALPFGLGTCWAGYVMMATAQSPAVAAVLDLPAGHVLHGAMMIGYPRFDYQRVPARRPADIRWR